MSIKTHVWRKVLEIGLLITLMTIGVALHPSADYLKQIVHLIPYLQSFFLLGLFVSLVGTLGLLSSCRNDRQFKLNFGRALYLPSLVGIATVLLTQGLILRVLTSLQFLISVLIFLLGFFLSWTS